MRGFLVRLSTLFGIGRLPKGPGTWGTLATVPLAVFLGWAGPLWHLAFLVLLIPVALIACELYEREKGSHDAKEVVIDESVGYLIAVTFLPFTWQSFVAGFLLFRLFDIWKPFPISVLDRRVQGGLGTLIDDVAAGLAASIILQFVATETAWLGIQTIVVVTG